MKIGKGKYSRIPINNYQLNSLIKIVITSIYATCNALERLELWDELERLAEEVDVPWIVEGDFNVILDQLEKLGGLPVSLQEIINFSQCINNCSLREIKFTGSAYTWWNGRIEDESVFKKA